MSAYLAAFIEAVLTGSSSQLAVCISEHEHNLQSFINEPMVKGATALCYAVSQGYNQIVLRLLQLAPIDVDANPKAAGTALHGACTAGNAEGLALLLVYGADVKLKDAQGNTAEQIIRGETCKQVLSIWQDNPMHKAVSILRSLFCLLKQARSCITGDSLSAILEDLYGACMDPTYSMSRIKALTRDYNIALSYRDGPLTKSEECLIKSLNSFAKGKIPIEGLGECIVTVYTSVIGSQPLPNVFAKSMQIEDEPKGEPETHQKLQEEHPKHRDEKKEKRHSKGKPMNKLLAVTVATTTTTPATSTTTLALGATTAASTSATESEQSPKDQPADLAELTGKFADAAWAGEIARTRNMLERSDTDKWINRYNDKGQTALYCACYRGHVPIVTELLIAQAQPEIADLKHGSTPMHAACYTGNAECVALLLTHGTTYNQFKNHLGLTARQEARGPVYGVIHLWESKPAHLAITEFRTLYPHVYVGDCYASHIMKKKLRRICGGDEPSDDAEMRSILAKMNQVVSGGTPSGRIVNFLYTITNYFGVDKTLTFTELQNFLSTFVYKEESVQKGLSIRRLRASTSLKVGGNPMARKDKETLQRRSTMESSGGSADGAKGNDEEVLMTIDTAITSLTLTWRLKNPRGWKKVNSFYTQTIVPGSYKWKSFCYFFNNVLESDALSVSGIEVVYNPQVVQDFRSFQDKVKRRQEENPSLFSAKDWKLTDDLKRREDVMERYHEYVKLFYWNDLIDELPVVPILHGTDYETAMKICNTGFTTLASVDEGWYGQGMYFSSSAVYNLPYFATKETPCLIMCFAVSGNVYPVTEDPSGKESLLGKPVKKGYHSHFVLTNKDGLIYKSPTRTPRGTDREEKKQYGEFVLFHESQVCHNVSATYPEELLLKHRKKGAFEASSKTERGKVSENVSVSEKPFSSEEHREKKEGEKKEKEEDEHKADQDSEEGPKKTVAHPPAVFTSSEPPPAAPVPLTPSPLLSESVKAPEREPTPESLPAIHAPKPKSVAIPISAKNQKERTARKLSKSSTTTQKILSQKKKKRHTTQEAPTQPGEDKPVNRLVQSEQQNPQPEQHQQEQAQLSSQTKPGASVDQYHEYESQLRTQYEQQLRFYEQQQQQVMQDYITFFQQYRQQVYLPAGEYGQAGSEYVQTGEYAQAYGEYTGQMGMGAGEQFNGECGQYWQAQVVGDVQENVEYPERQQTEQRGSTVQTNAREQTHKQEEPSQHEAAEIVSQNNPNREEAQELPKQAEVTLVAEAHIVIENKEVLAVDTNTEPTEDPKISAELPESLVMKQNSVPNVESASIEPESLLDECTGEYELKAEEKNHVGYDNTEPATSSADENGGASEELYSQLQGEHIAARDVQGSSEANPYSTDFQREPKYPAKDSELPIENVKMPVIPPLEEVICTSKVPQGEEPKFAIEGEQMPAIPSPSFPQLQTQPQQANEMMPVMIYNTRGNTAIYTTMGPYQDTSGPTLYHSAHFHTANPQAPHYVQNTFATTPEPGMLATAPIPFMPEQRAEGGSLFSVFENCTMFQFLSSKGLQKYEAKLHEIGFHTIQDFQELTLEGDVRELGVEVGMNFVEQKKLRNLIQHLF